MKIAIFIENNQNGGLDTFCSSLINYWPNNEDSFIVICNSSHPGQELLQNSILKKCKFVFHNVPLSWVIAKKIFFFLPTSIRRVFQPILRIIFFPVQSFLIKNIFLKNIANELIVVNGGFPGGESCRIANIVWTSIGRRPGIHNYHNFAVLPRFGLGWFENWIDKKLLNATKLFISVSEACSMSLHKRKVFNNLLQNRYIYNGVVVQDNFPINTFDLRKELNIGPNPLCLMLGNYEPRKGHKFIFDVFKEVIKDLPDAHLVTCGGGTDNEFAEVTRLKNQISPSNQIHLLGFIPDGASLISQADLLLIGSQEFESFGLTAIEAMVRGVPVISTDIGGLPEVIGQDESCGFIVSHLDIHKYANKVMIALTDKQLRSSFSDRGKKRVFELFQVTRMSQQYLDALNE